MVARSHRGEAGKVRAGCLVTLLVLAIGAYVGIKYFEVQFRYYRMQDEVKTQAAFAPVLSDDVIRRRLVAAADSLGLPLGPKRWSIRRSAAPRQIFISAQYQDSVVFALPGWRKVWRFRFTPGASEMY